MKHVSVITYLNQTTNLNIHFYYTKELRETSILSFVILFLSTLIVQEVFQEVRFM